MLLVNVKESIELKICNSRCKCAYYFLSLLQTSLSLILTVMERTYAEVVRSNSSSDEFCEEVGYQQYQREAEDDAIIIATKNSLEDVKVIYFPVV